MPLLEVACFDAESAFVASRAGADRIECCADRDAGGTTPLRETLEVVVQQAGCPVFAMIRPRGGNFVYSGAEFDQMKADIARLKDLADGFVLGCLDESRCIDIAKTTELVQLAEGRPCTFHRAFDQVKEPLQALEDVIATGCMAVLTSGCAASVTTGLATLAQLVSKADQRIEVMPGGGVRSANVGELQRVVGASSYHSSGILAGCSLPDESEIKRMKELIHMVRQGQE